MIATSVISLMFRNCSITDSLTQTIFSIIDITLFMQHFFRLFSLLDDPFLLSNSFSFQFNLSLTILFLRLVHSKFSVTFSRLLHKTQFFSIQNSAFYFQDFNPKLSVTFSFIPHLNWESLFLDLSIQLGAFPFQDFHPKLSFTFPKHF